MVARSSLYGFSSGIAILIVVVLVLGAMVWGLWPRGKTFEQVTGWTLPWMASDTKTGPKTNDASGDFVNLQERLQIEEWITRNRLNQYGDPSDTLYEGGSPLMDEATGKLMTRYEYIFKLHPNKPWKK